MMMKGGNTMLDDIVSSKISSFTDSVRRSIEEQNWYAALTVALTLPDICGKLECPELYSGQRYAKWFDENMQKYQGFVTGNDAFALRCAYLHGGEANISEQKKKEILDEFMFTAPKVFEGKYTGNHNIKINRFLMLRVDQFCLDICDAVNLWADNNNDNTGIQSSARKMIEIIDGDIQIGPVYIGY